MELSQERESFHRNTVELPKNGKHRIPATGRGRRTKDLVETAKMPDRLHVTAIHSKHKPAS